MNSWGRPCGRWGRVVRMHTPLRLVFAASVLSIAVSASASTPFNDVSFDHPNADAIAYLKAEGIVEGYADGGFHPDMPINRAEFTKIVTGAQFNAQSTIDSCLSSYPSLGFFDVRNSDWFAKYICVAKSKGIVSGYPNGAFSPASGINFAEASKILVRTFVGDVETDPVWYKPYVEKMASFNAIPTNIQTMTQPIMRGDMAEMIYRLKTGNNDKPSKTYGELSGTANARLFVEQGFSVDLPLEWTVFGEKAMQDAWVATFGPKSHLGHDATWSIRVYDADAADIDDLIAGIARQFADRTVLRDVIPIEGVPATKVVVTTPQSPLFLSQNIFIEADGKIFRISNGGIDDELNRLFMDFYYSFRLAQ